MAIFALVIYVVHRLLGEYRWRDVVHRIRTIPGADIGGAAWLAALSYLLLTGFDALGQKYVGRDIPYRRTAMVIISATVTKN